jgi:hypothetical protein
MIIKKSFRTLGRAASAATIHAATTVGAAVGLTMGCTIGCAVLVRRLCQVPPAGPPSPELRPSVARANTAAPACFLSDVTINRLRVLSLTIVPVSPQITATARPVDQDAAALCSAKTSSEVRPGSP